MPKAVIAGVGMTPFGRFLERGLKSLSEEAVAKALADAGIGAGDIECVYFGNAAAGVVTGQEMIRAQSSLRNTGLSGKPMYNIENACASSSSAFNLARTAVVAGQYDCVMVVGAEKLTHEDKRVSFDAFARGVDLDEPLVPGIGSGSGSIFMDIYAAKTRKWMTGTSVEPSDFARVCVKSRLAGSLNPDAQFHVPTTIDEVLGSRVVSAPLTLFMCSSIGDGAAAIVVCSEAFARKHGIKPVFVNASAIVTAPGVLDVEPVAISASRMAYEEAGIGPQDLHVIELHDASAPAELIHYENLGLCEPGGAAQLIRSGDTGLGGRISVNPSGGLLSRGHPVGATGAAQLVELTNQLRGRAGKRQRPGATVALAENNGGQLAGDSAVALVTILTT